MPKQWAQTILKVRFRSVFTRSQFITLELQFFQKPVSRKKYFVWQKLNDVLMLNIREHKATRHGLRLRLWLAVIFSGNSGLHLALKVNFTSPQFWADFISEIHRSGKSLIMLCFCNVTTKYHMDLMTAYGYMTSLKPVDLERSCSQTNLGIQSADPILDQRAWGTFWQWKWHVRNRILEWDVESSQISSGRVILIL